MITPALQPYMNTREDPAFRFLGLPTLIRSTSETTNGAFGLMEHWSMHAGFATPYHLHHLEDEAFYVLDGEMAFACDGKWIEGGPGAYVFGPRDIPHGFKVIGTTPARMLLMCAPAGFERFWRWVRTSRLRKRRLTWRSWLRWLRNTRSTFSGHCRKKPAYGPKDRKVSLPTTQAASRRSRRPACAGPAANDCANRELSGSAPFDRKRPTMGSGRRPRPAVPLGQKPCLPQHAHTLVGLTATMSASSIQRIPCNDVQSTLQGACMPGRSNMTWEKSSQELVDLFTSLAPTGAGVEQKKMFGWPCCFFNGNLFIGLHKQSMIFRLAEADRADFLKLDGASEFEPMPGRKMKGYVILSEPAQRDPKELSQWINRSLQFASALPAKEKAARPAAKTKRKSKA